MKKIILSTICGVLALTLVGCGSGSEDTIIKNLSNQLDRVTDNVSKSSYNMQTILPQTYTYNGYRQSNSVSNRTTNQPAVLNEQTMRISGATSEHEALKQSVLSSAGFLKNTINQGNLKLNKNQISALNSLANNISKYVAELNTTSSPIATSIKNIRKNSTTSGFNSDKLSTSYQILNTHLDTRITYLRNLLSTIEQAQNVVDGITSYNYNESQNGYNANNISYNNYYNFANNGTNNGSNNSPNNNSTTSNQDTTTENKNNTIKNIDTYKTYDNNPTLNNANENTQQNNYGAANYYNGYNGAYNRVPYNAYYNGANGYNYGYGRYGRGIFNPNRNTDTYLPNNYNIDSYRGYPYGIMNRPNAQYPLTQEVTNTSSQNENTTEQNTKTDINDHKQNTITNSTSSDKNQKPSSLQARKPFKRIESTQNANKNFSNYSRNSTKKEGSESEKTIASMATLPNDIKKDGKQKVIRLPNTPTNQEETIRLPHEPKSTEQDLV